MVDRVIGKANDFELIFVHKEGDCWEAVTPPNVYGEYPVELWAYDTAGNVSYMATMLYIVSEHTLQAYLIPIEYAGILDSQELIALLDQYGLEAVLAELKILQGGVDHWRESTLILEKKDTYA
ncbi:Ig-like domain repeat protein [Muricomes sp. OA1]|uniref:PF13754 domain-containing protein n=1 Tax=Muricomes sp. OA1 TaxID=2914165 RepID=UPI001F064FDB|nr:PF13754 domain-containing protein [Muricomes sp. OA1]MCH1973533.1 Ig-like domain repeat protein [Muricomes sp. OA1]